MIRWSRLLVILGLGLLVACNPKPEVIESKTEEAKSYKMIEHVDKLTDFSNVLEEDSLLGPLNQLAHYYNSEVTSQELPEVGIRYLDGGFSVLDVLEIYEKKGLTLYPDYTTFDEVEQAVMEDKPVFATFTLMGSNSFSVLFTGYSDDELVMIDLLTGNERKLSKKHLAAVKTYDAFIPYPDNNINLEVLNDSVRYLDLAISDAYYGNNGDLLQHFMKLIEEKSLENEVNAFNYIKCYYYTFFDRKLNIVEPLLQEEMKTTVTPPYFEIALILANENQDENKMKSILSQLQILSFYQDETLQLIMEKGDQYGFLEKVEQAENYLRQRKDRH